MANASDPPSGQPPGLRGRFLTLEGIDGCGKSTQAKLLTERLREGGLPVLVTREPGGTAIGQQLRAVLLSAESSALEPQAELLLFLADRVQHLREVIRPALARGEIVLCDRFHDATVAYQGHARGLNLSALQTFIGREVLSTPPDTTYWLDLPVEQAQRRIHARGTGADDESRLDAADVAFHERVRAGYAAIAQEEPQRVVRIDASVGIDVLHERIWADLQGRYDVV